MTSAQTNLRADSAEGGVGITEPFRFLDPTSPSQITGTVVAVRMPSSRGGRRGKSDEMIRTVSVGFLFCTMLVGATLSAQNAEASPFVINLRAPGSSGGGGGSSSGGGGNSSGGGGASHANWGGGAGGSGGFGGSSGGGAFTMPGSKPYSVATLATVTGLADAKGSAAIGALLPTLTAAPGANVTAGPGADVAASGGGLASASIVHLDLGNSDYLTVSGPIGSSLVTPQDPAHSPQASTIADVKRTKSTENATTTGGMPELQSDGPAQLVAANLLAGSVIPTIADGLISPPAATASFSVNDLAAADPTPVPEPGSLVLFGSGLAFAARWLARRRKVRSAHPPVS